jgi:hypothetical protein
MSWLNAVAFRRHCNRRTSTDARLLGKIPRVGQPEFFQRFAHMGRLRPVQREVHVQSVDAVREDDGALLIDPGSQVMPGLSHRQQCNVVTRSDLDGEQRACRQVGSSRGLSKMRPKVANRDRFPHDLPVAAGCVHHPFFARPEAEKEQSGRLPASRRYRHAVVDGLRDEAQQEPRLVATEVQQRPLAIRVCPQLPRCTCPSTRATSPIRPDIA